MRFTLSREFLAVRTVPLPHGLRPPPDLSAKGGGGDYSKPAGFELE